MPDYAVTITTTLLRQLLGSGAEDPVLYIDTEQDEPELNVWTGAYVNHDQVVLTRADLIDQLGHDWSDEEVAEYLPELQEATDAILDALKDAQ